MKRLISIASVLVLLVSLCATFFPNFSTDKAFEKKIISQNDSTKKQKKMSYKINKTETDWKNELSPEKYRVLRQKGTERAFTGEFYDHHEEGIYTCGACGQALFSSETKYESGSGWPSFYSPIKEGHVEEIRDVSHGMVRTEVVCSNCGSHLGHVFEDGPKPTGLRYCINSISLDFEKK